MRTLTFNFHGGEKFSKKSIFFTLRETTAHPLTCSGYTSKTIRNCFLEALVSDWQCQSLGVPPAHFGRCQGIKITPGHSAVGYMVWCIRVMQCKFTFCLFRGLLCFFLKGFQFCYSGAKQVTSVLKSGSVLKVCLSQGWNCYLMKFTTQFSLPWSPPAHSWRPVYIGSYTDGFWGFSWLQPASSDVSSPQVMPCK